MIRSMTGYAKAAGVVCGGHAVLEIHSINKRNLEMHILMPHACLQYDLLLREWIRRAVTRGQLTVRLRVEPREGAPPESEQTETSLKRLKRHWERAAAALGYDPQTEVTLAFLLKQEALFAKEEIKEAELEALTKRALGALLKMKEREGAALARDLKGRIEGMKTTLNQIEKRAPRAACRFEARLKERLQGFTLPDQEERIAREVVLYADKADVTEEIVRLRSHFDQFLLSLKAKKTQVGRTLEFLAQEILRELTTLSSKASDTEMEQQAVEMKSELDKIREQVQNIE